MYKRTVIKWSCAVGVGILALSAPVMAQCTPTATTNGPDVIVGDITGPTNYTGDGTVDAFSIGTYSCNIGNVWLNWIAGTNQHPVISQALYKMKTDNGYTRFEQLGQSWLKHGFYALSDNLCCTNCQATDGTHLGVHCSDPYTSTRNGSQPGLGPKYQVNAATGVFPYPPANPAYSGSVARRLQAHVTDLEVSSATVRYFVGAMYVVSDEPAANRFNNQSYRACNMSGSGTAWTMALTGSTQRTRPGLRAWGDNEAGVATKEVSVPNEGANGIMGEFIVAAKATDLGNGTWHYEYAIQNLCSDRSGQAVTIDCPSGVTLTNIGFHDVDYHDGDGAGNVNCDGTDWSATVGNGTITWATQTYADNVNANALRWDTIYNFRFDANTAPANGNLTIALFKPGTPDSITAGGVPVPTPPTVIPGDLDGDGHVSLSDLTLLLASFAACQGDAAFNPAADLDHSNCVDLADLAILLGNFGQ